MTSLREDFILAESLSVPETYLREDFILAEALAVPVTKLREDFILAEVVIFTGGGPTSFPNGIAVGEAFTTAPLAATPNFVTLGRVRSFDIRLCGRTSELDRPNAGTATFIVDARDRAIDPANTASPFYPNVIPNRRVRFTLNTPSNATYTLFEGFADAHNIGYRINSDAVCDLACTDGFKILARAKLTGMAARPVEKSSERLTAILDYVGWPSTRRTISTGRAILAAEDISDRYALDACLEIDQTENGRFHIDAAGYAVFLSRHDMQTATRQTTSQVTFGDAGGLEIPYSNIVFENSETLLRNTVEITHPTFDPVTVTDATSVTAHGPITYSREVRDASTQGMNATAQRLLALYKDPITRVLGLTVNVGHPATAYPNGLWDAVLSLKVGDRVTVKRTPPGGGAVISQECFIDLITHTAAATAQNWQTTFGLAYAGPAQTWATWGPGFIWGTSKWSY